VTRSPTQYQPTLTSGQKMNYRILLLVAAMGLLLLVGKCTDTPPCLTGQVWGVPLLTSSLNCKYYFPLRLSTTDHVGRLMNVTVSFHLNPNRKSRICREDAVLLSIRTSNVAKLATVIRPLKLGEFSWKRQSQFIQHYTGSS
jgi:hypothetical protein